jgi:hypothetical protein
MKPLTPEIEYCRATVRVWERLRILYNAILLLPGVALIWRTLHLQKPTGRGSYPLGEPLELIATALAFGLGANICYCLGPYVEFVMTALGLPLSGERTRYFVFGLGVLLSISMIGLSWLYVEYYFVTPLVPSTGP